MTTSILPGGVQRGPVWLVTLADLIALLLTFFVLIFSMSSLDSHKWEAVADGFAAGSLAPVPANATRPRAESNIELTRAELGTDLGYLDSVLRDHLSGDPLLAGSVVGRAPDALVVSLPAHLLFTSGSDVLTADARPALFRLGGLLANVRNEVAIVGHTDPEPIASARFPSNWELSLSRAFSVGEALRQAGYRRDVEIMGAADGRFADISPELDQDRRSALGRRVDLLIRDTKGH